MGNLFSDESNNSNEEQNQHTISEINQNLMNSIFTNNSILNMQEQMNIIGIKNTSMKKVKTYENPFMLNRDSVKLERKYDNENEYYLKFSYFNTGKPCNVEIIQNAAFIKEGKKTFFEPSLCFKDKILRYQLKSSISKCSSNKDEAPILESNDFEDKDCFINLKYLEENKVNKSNYYDLIIQATYSEENSFVSLVNIYNSHHEIKPKVESQKIKVKGIWFEIFSIYGMSEDKENQANDCEICYSKEKNIIFLPCKHSYCCDICAVNIRMRGNWCPICRNTITDTIQIEKNKEIEKEA